jgi:hypothetical protein
LLGSPGSVPNTVKAIVNSIFHQEAVRKNPVLPSVLESLQVFIADTESMKSGFNVALYASGDGGSRDGDYLFRTCSAFLALRAVRFMFKRLTLEEIIAYFDNGDMIIITNIHEVAFLFISCLKTKLLHCQELVTLGL